MIPYFFMEVKCIGNTQIIHMEETRMTQRTIGLVCEFCLPKRQHKLSQQPVFLTYLIHIHAASLR